MTNESGAEGGNPLQNGNTLGFQHNLKFAVDTPIYVDSTSNRNEAVDEMRPMVNLAS